MWQYTSEIFRFSNDWIIFNVPIFSYWPGFMTFRGVCNLYEQFLKTAYNVRESSVSKSNILQLLKSFEI